MDTATALAQRRGDFEDGLGKRHYAVGPGGELLEVLELREEFSTSSFEVALRERVTALTDFQNTCFSRVRSVQRLRTNSSKLLIVSDRVFGARLSSVLALARQQLRPLETNAALCVIRQVVQATALLHQKPALSHGAIGAERIVITPNARLVIVDHVLAPALEQLHYSHDRYWKDLRVALPPAAQPTFDQRADVMQIGMVALSLILGRPIDADEYPDRIASLVDRAPIRAELHAWLLRMLQLDREQPFASAAEAWNDLTNVLGAGDNVAWFAALEFFMAEHARSTPARAVATTASVAAAAAAAAAPVAALSGVTPSISAVVPTASAPSTETPITSTEASALSSRHPDPSPMFSDFTASDTEPTAGSQTLAVAEDDVSQASRGRRRRWIAAAAVFIVLLSGGAFFGRHYLNLMPPAAAEATGTLVVNTNPIGVAVAVDGQPRGVTPLTLELAPGAHELKLETEGEPRIIPLMMTAGSTVAHTIELPKVAPRTGQIVVRTEPPGARVTIDDLPVGTTPLTLEGLTPGTHSVVLATDVSSVTQTVTIEAGITASLVVPMSAPQGVPVSGWISVTAPAEVHVYEDDRLLGTSRSERIMVSAGRHELTLVSETLGYSAARSVEVSPGKVSPIKLEWPKGSMALNAQPWAEVWIGGERVGETPIGRFEVPIGAHEVLFRHPQLGEQAVRVTVTAGAPTRVSVNMTKR